MSAHEKDPIEKQDTPSESSSSDSLSDSEVEKAEENLEHLKIGDPQAKEASKDRKETKPLDSPEHEGTLTAKYDLSSQPVAGPSGLQEPHLPSSIGTSDPKPEAAGLPQPRKEKVEAKDADEDIGAKMVQGDSDFSSITPSSLTRVTPLEELGGKKMVQPSRPPADIDYGKLPQGDVLGHFFARDPQLSSSSRRSRFATDSANTSSDISEIRSEIADTSTETSYYQDAAENFAKEESPSFVTALERQSPEASASDSNISDLQDDYLPPLPSLASTSTSTSTGERIRRAYLEQDSDMSELHDDSAPQPTSSVSVSTNTGDQGHQAYLEQLMREAEERGRPISTSSGFGSTDPSELANLQAWGAAGEAGSYRRNEQHAIDLPSPDMGDIGAVGGEPAHESMEQQVLRDQQMQVQKQPVEELSAPDAVMSGGIGRRIPQSLEVSNLEAASPSKRRRFSKCSSDSSREEVIAERLRPRHRPDSAKKSKSLPSKQKSASHSSSGSPEPKSSSSDELLRKDSPDIRSSSKSRESSPSEKGRKPWQKPGSLRSRQVSTMSPKDSVIVEEDEDRASSSKDQDTESMVTKPAAPEQMETTVEISAEGVSTSVEQSSSRPSAESSDQAYASGTDLPLKEVEETFEEPEFERSVGKSKRQPKLSNSPPSDEMLGSSPPKAATAAEAVSTSRPKKKSRPDKLPEKTRRPRHDSGGPPPKSLSLGNLQHSESTSTPDTSDYTPSDEEKETPF